MTSCGNTITVTVLPWNFVEEEFQELQDDFMEKHYEEFEETEENKLIYTEIHKQYVCTF